MKEQHRECVQSQPLSVSGGDGGEQMQPSSEPRPELNGLIKLHESDGLSIKTPPEADVSGFWRQAHTAQCLNVVPITAASSDPEGDTGGEKSLGKNHGKRMYTPTHSASLA